MPTFVAPEMLGKKTKDELTDILKRLGYHPRENGRDPNLAPVDIRGAKPE